MTVPTLTPRAAREQRAFRALLDAMARPGTVGRVAPHPRGGPFAAAIALLEALLDHEVSFAVLPDDADTTDTLLRLTGSRLAAPPLADYLLVHGDGLGAAIGQAKIGTPAYPDRSATIIAPVRTISAAPGAGATLTLAGPGINGTRTVTIAGLAAGALAGWQARNADVPLGVDLTLVAADGRFTCLPRYTRILEER